MKITNLGNLTWWTFLHVLREAGNPPTQSVQLYKSGEKLFYFQWNKELCTESIVEIESMEELWDFAKTQRFQEAPFYKNQLTDKDQIEEAKRLGFLPMSWQPTFQPAPKAKAQPISEDKRKALQNLTLEELLK